MCDVRTARIVNHNHFLIKPTLLSRRNRALFCWTMQMRALTFMQKLNEG